jgi:superfamily II DNA or RNA helicase
MSSTTTLPAPSASAPTTSRSSATWPTLCAETLRGIADPLFPALSTAATASPGDAARAMLAGLLEPLEPALSREALPQWLLPHQADAVTRSRAIMARFGGVLVADGVGLGKTFIALALAALERRCGGDAVAVVPAALKPEWRRAAEATGVRVPLVSHTALAHGAPEPPARCTLILVDEAHAFRNPRTRRYDALARLSVGRRVALLTATPLNNTPGDLAALVQLFAARDRFRELGVADLAEALRDGSPAAAAPALGAISVCRTRRLVEERFPELAGSFPRRVLLPAARYDLEATYDRALSSILTALGGLQGAAHAAALMQLGLLRRLESSRAAFRRSLLRHRDFIEEWRAAREAGATLSRVDYRAAFARRDEDDTQLVLWPLLSRQSGPPPAEGDLVAWRRAVEHAIRLADVSESVPDQKLEALQALLDGELAGVKTVVFTEYRDTARYLFRQLKTRRRVVAVLGRDAWAASGRLARAEALDAFAPRARGARPDALLAADLLIATDVASEGLNLQDAAAVVNYDLPWNPVRVMQRVGRVDRLDSPHQQVFVAHLLPAEGLARVTGVLERLRRKLEDLPSTLGAEPDPLAALWWLEMGAPDPAFLEREAWRAVAPFESRERWRALLGPCSVARGAQALVAAGVAGDGGPPAAGLLLAIEWANGRRIPLPYCLTRRGAVRQDSVALGELAERALRARPLPSSPSDFSDVLSSVLPEAHRRLMECTGGRHAETSGPGRRAALELVARQAESAARRRASTEAAERALTALRQELPAGLDRLLARLASEPAAPEELATRIAEIVERSAPPPGPDLTGTPRLVLVAALALAARCADD